MKPVSVRPAEIVAMRTQPGSRAAGWTTATRSRETSLCSTQRGGLMLPRLFPGLTEFLDRWLPPSAFYLIRSRPARYKRRTRLSGSSCTSTTAKRLADPGESSIPPRSYMRSPAAKISYKDSRTAEELVYSDDCNHRSFDLASPWASGGYFENSCSISSDLHVAV